MLNKLQKMRQNMKKKGKGFTLVELIVVIIIIAIIAAVAIPRITAFQENARKSRIQSEHRQLVTAIQSRIAQSTEPTEEHKSIDNIEKLADYMNLKTGQTVTQAVAKDGGKPAHKIENGKLISTYTDPAAKTGGASRTETWEYGIAPNK